MKRKFAKRAFLLTSLAAAIYIALHSTEETANNAELEHSNRSTPESTRSKAKTSIPVRPKVVQKTSEHPSPRMETPEAEPEIPQIDDSLYATEKSDPRNVSTVSVEGGLLTIEANDAPLSELLIQISTATGIPIDSSRVASDELVTVSLHKSPIDSAIGKILNNYDYFFLYSSSAANLKAVWIYPKGTGHKIVLQDYADPTNHFIEDDLYASDSTIRTEALEKYIRAGNDDSLQKIQDALYDKDENVRAMALHLAMENDIEISSDLLLEIAQLDGSSMIRSIAMNAYATRDDVSEAAITDLAETALEDPDEFIREKAQAILDELATADVTTNTDEQSGSGQRAEEF